MDSKLEKRCSDIWWSRGALVSFHVKLGLMPHLGNLQMNYRKIYASWDPIDGDNDDTFRTLTEIFYTDIFIVLGITDSWNYRNKLEEKLLKGCISNPDSDAMWFIYHMGNVVVRVRSSYDKLALLISRQLKFKLQSKRFKGKINEIKEKLKNKKDYTKLKDFVDKLPGAVKSIKKYRDPMLHQIEKKFNIFNLDDSENVWEYNEYFDNINRAVNELYLLLIEYIQIITGKTYTELRS